MEIESSFQVQAPADRVYAFLLDVNRVVACVPGAQLAEVVDPDTFKGRVRIKVGPVTVSYQGTARITERDAQERSATLSAEGRETTGSGSARATTRMSVQAEGSTSTVRFVTDLSVVGRVAQFGRGIMEDVSRHLVAQMGECIRSRLEDETTGEVSGRPVPAPVTAPGSAGTGRERRAASGARRSASEGAAPRRASSPTTRAGAAPRTAKRGARKAPASAASLPPRPTRADAPEVRIAPADSDAASLDALALARAVAAERLVRLSRRPGLLVAISTAVAAIGLLIGWRLRRR